MRSALPLSASLALLLVGCGQKPQQVGGVPRTGPPPTVVSLSPSTTEIVAGDFSQQLLVGRTASDDFPKTVSSVPVVAEVKPDFEAIKKANPGLVVYDGDLYNADDIKRIESGGAKAFAFKAHDVLGFEKELYELSGILGSETNVSGYVDRIERERNAAADHPTPAPKVAVVMGNGDYLAGTNSFVADVIKVGGGVPVGPASDKFAPMSPEALVAAAPDLIILATTKENAAKDIATLRANTRFATTPAMKSGRVSAIDQDVVLRRGSRVDALIRDVHKAINVGNGK